MRRCTSTAMHAAAGTEKTGCDSALAAKRQLQLQLPNCQRGGYHVDGEVRRADSPRDRQQAWRDGATHIVSAGLACRSCTSRPSVSLCAAGREQAAASVPAGLPAGKAASGSPAFLPEVLRGRAEQLQALRGSCLRKHAPALPVRSLCLSPIAVVALGPAVRPQRSAGRRLQLTGAAGMLSQAGAAGLLLSPSGYGERALRDASCPLRSCCSGASALGLGCACCFGCRGACRHQL